MLVCSGAGKPRGPGLLSGLEIKWEQPVQRIGIAGIGLMGTAIAQRLLGAGFAVAGYDVEPEKRARLAQLGATPVSAPAALAEQCDTIFLAVFSTDQVEEVIEGEDGLLGARKPSSPRLTLICTSTCDPERIAASPRASSRRRSAFSRCRCRARAARWRRAMASDSWRVHGKSRMPCPRCCRRCAPGGSFWARWATAAKRSSPSISCSVLIGARSRRDSYSPQGWVSIRWRFSTCCATRRPIRR